MSKDLEPVRGRNNPFENVGPLEADAKLIKADLAARSSRFCESSS